ncbi:MAG: hypothetical protein ACON5F_03475 [Jejuia sp.]
MKILNSNNLKLFLLLPVFCLTIVSCSSDDDLSAIITVNEGPTNDIGGDFMGNGGDGSRTISWTNSLSTADYNADITATSSGVFQIVVADANGAVVLDKSLNGNTEPDSIDGVTSAGEPGLWTVTITLTSFKGDGSYSLSAGD